MKSECICEWVPPKRIQGQRGEGNERMGCHLSGNTTSATLWGKSRNNFHIAQTRTRNIFAWLFFIKHHLCASSQWIFYCFCIFRGLKCSKRLFITPLGLKKKVQLQKEYGNWCARFHGRAVPLYGRKHDVLLKKVFGPRSKCRICNCCHIQAKFSLTRLDEMVL